MSDTNSFASQSPAQIGHPNGTSLLADPPADPPPIGTKLPKGDGTVIKRFINSIACKVCGEPCGGCETRIFSDPSPEGFVFCWDETRKSKKSYVRPTDLGYKHRVPGKCYCGEEHTPDDRKPPNPTTAAVMAKVLRLADALPDVVELPKGLAGRSDGYTPGLPRGGRARTKDNEAAQWPTLAPGTKVRAGDRDNYGTVEEDLGSRARIHFESPDGHTATKVLPKSILTALDGSPLGEGMVLAELASMSDAELGIQPASGIEDRPIEWLWDYRLAAGEMALLAGDGGMGKSALLLAIAAKLSLGGEWWDGGAVPIGNTIIVSAEDDAATTIIPRLKALEADLSRITILSARMTINKPGKEPEIHPQTLQDRPYWKEVLRRHPEARLLIVDPLPSYLGRGVSDAKNSELRGVLEPFIEHVTRPAGVCLLANTHLNKSIDAKTPVHRITGSIAYVNLPRNVHVVVPDSDNPSRRFFKQAKCNNAPDDLSALAFTMEKKLLSSARGEIETAIPRFEEGAISVDLSQIMNGSDRRRGPKPVKSEKLATWLFDYLSQYPHPVPVGRIYDEAEAAFADEVPHPFGTKGYDGKWSNGKALWRAADYIPKLPDPRNGKRVERYQAPDGSSHRWVMHLINADAAY